MTTELWLRNPWNARSYLPQQPRVVWTKQFLKDTRFTTEAFTQFHLVGQAYRMLTVDLEQTTEQTESGTTTHPTWIYGDKQSRLESYLREELPMVVISGIPIFRPPFIEFFLWLGSLQEEYPDTVIHLHGAQSFGQIFGLGLRSADYDPIEDARSSKVTLPCGRRIAHEEWATWGKWFRLIGWNWRELDSLQDRVQFNISAAYWAAEYFRKEIPFAFRRSQGTSLKQVKPDEVPLTNSFIDAYRRRHAEEGDKVICDACSLAPHCKLYREGAVCTLNDSPTRDLARMFNSRDSNKIIDGLGKLLEMQAERIAEARNREQFNEDGLDEKVTKLIDNMVNQAVKVAKLVNPALANPKMQVNVGILSQAQNASPKELAAAAIAELEARGHDRDNITMPMIEEQIREMTGAPAAIEVSGSVNDD